MTEAVAVPYPLGEADYSVPPGETLRELLEEQDISQRELARRADLSPKHVNRLVQGLVPLSADIAQRLELVTGTPARIWNTLEANYRSDLERLRSRQALAVDVSWLGELPVKALVDRGTLPDQPSDKPSRMEQMLRFFGVASVGAWHDIYADTACAFRQTKACEAKPGSRTAHRPARIRAKQKKQKRTGSLATCSSPLATLRAFQRLRRSTTYSVSPTVSTSPPASSSGAFSMTTFGRILAGTG